MIIAGPLNLVISGVGGQGNILLSRIIGRALLKKGLSVSIMDTFGAAQRGGAVKSDVRISEVKSRETIIPAGRTHIILSLEPLEALRSLVEYGNPRVLTLTNSQPTFPLEVFAGDVDYPDYGELKKAIVELSEKAWFIDATDIAYRIDAPHSVNVVMLGALVRTNSIPLDTGDLEDEIRDSFPRERVEQNLKALRQGFDAL